MWPPSQHIALHWDTSRSLSGCKCFRILDISWRVRKLCTSFTIVIKTTCSISSMYYYELHCDHLANHKLPLIFYFHQGVFFWRFLRGRDDCLNQQAAGRRHVMECLPKNGLIAATHLHYIFVFLFCAGAWPRNTESVVSWLACVPFTFTKLPPVVGGGLHSHSSPG